LAIKYPVAGDHMPGTVIDMLDQHLATGAYTFYFTYAVLRTVASRRAGTAVE
jgi:hypothetical protein